MGKNVGGGGLGGGGAGGGGGSGGGNVGGGSKSGGKSSGSGSNSGTTSYGAPVHTVTGPVYGGIQVAKSPQAWSALNNQVNTYNDAATKWNASAQTPSVGNFFNNIAPMGLSMQAPEFGKPKTYVGGDYHMGLNPADLAGGLLGGLIAPGAGLLTGPLAGKLYQQAGLSNVMLGGGQVPGEWGLNGGGGYPSQMAGGMPGNMPSSQQTAQNQGHQNSAADHLQQLAQLNTGIPGNPAAPVNSGTATAAAPGLPGPNYSQMMARMQPVTPNYGVQLPGYQYSGRTGATV